MLPGRCFLMRFTCTVMGRRGPALGAARAARSVGARGSAQAVVGGAQQSAALPHLRHQHRHAQVLEAAGVAVAALLDPQVGHAQGLATKALGPEQVAVAFEHADNVIVRNPLRARSRRSSTRHISYRPHYCYPCPASGSAGWRAMHATKALQPPLSPIAPPVRGTGAAPSPAAPTPSWTTRRCHTATRWCPRGCQTASSSTPGHSWTEPAADGARGE
jgi:hypothetical protein